MPRKPVIPPVPPAQHWSLDYLAVFAEAECAMGEFCEAADADRLENFADRDYHLIVAQLTETASGALFLLNQLRHWHCREHSECHRCATKIVEDRHGNRTCPACGR